MPNISFETLDQVPESLRSFAREDAESGKVLISVVPEQRLSEFRDNNTKLMNEREELTQKMTAYSQLIGDDVDAFKNDLEDLRGIRQRVQDGKLKESGEVEAALSKRTEEMRKGYQDQLSAEAKEKNAWKQRAEAENARFKESLIVSAIKDACIDQEVGVAPSAIRDITQFAKGVFRVSDDGKLTAYNGDAVIYGGDSDPISPKEWVQRQKDASPHWFKGSHGGGAGGERPGDKIIGKAKFSADQWKGMSARERLAAANGEPGASGF